MNDIALYGCTPTPLSHYLKALGILRVISEQVDPDAAACWQDEIFFLKTRMNASELQRFFLKDYRPTPILAPWNGGSGFYPRDNQSGIGAIEQGQALRFTDFKSQIVAIRQTLTALGFEKRPEGNDKTTLLNHLRSSLPDKSLDWLDAAVVLAGEDPKYPPLLGTGGNDGRLDFTNNFMQRLAQLFDPQTGDPINDCRSLLAGALFAKPIPGLAAGSIGQFSPGAAGGPNASNGFEGSSLINAWDFVLMLEGALLFAAAITRKHQSAGPGILSYPFTVRPTGSGSGAAALADEAPARAEMWLPLWMRPTSHQELRNLLSEGRISLAAKPARDGLDAVRALAHLGVDRGISAFQRYAFMMRSGKAFLATPLNRLQVKRNSAADLIDDLDRHNWLSRFRRMARNKDRPGRVSGLARRLENAVFNLAQESRPGHVQAVLVALGAIQRYLATNPQRREECPPVPRLASDWTRQADDHSADFRVAAALASLHGYERHTTEKTENQTRQPRILLPLAAQIAPIDLGGKPIWDEDSREVGWGEGALDDNLFAVVQRRLIVYEQAGLLDKPFAGSPLADLSAIGRFLNGESDDRRITDLLMGLCLVTPPLYLPGAKPTGAILPAAYKVLKPLFATQAQLIEAKLITPDGTLPLPVSLPRLLHSQRLDGPQGALAIAQRRRSASGLPAGFYIDSAPGLDGARLLSALLIPIRKDDLQTLQRHTDNRRETETT